MSRLLTLGLLGALASSAAGCLSDSGPQFRFSDLSLPGGNALSGVPEQWEPEIASEPAPQTADSTDERE